MKETINLRYSQEKKVIKKRALLKVKKMLPLLGPMMVMVVLAIIIVVINGHTLYTIKKLDEALNEKQKLAVIFENLDHKKELVKTRREMIDHLERSGALAYRVMEDLPLQVDKIDLIQVHYRDGTIRIVGHCASQEEIGELCDRLNTINGLGQTKISQVRNLMAGRYSDQKDLDLIWEFSLESDIKEDGSHEVSKKE